MEYQICMVNNGPVLRYGAGESVGHDDHPREEGGNAQQQANTELEFAYLADVFQNVVIVVRLFSLRFV